MASPNSAQMREGVPEPPKKGGLQPREEQRVRNR